MLRIRLILWYSFLVGITIVTIALAETWYLRNSLVGALNQSLLNDANSALHLISTLPAGISPRMIIERGELHGSSLRDIVDRALSEIPDSTRGTALADRVVSELIDQVLVELTYQDSSHAITGPLDAFVQHTVSGYRNNLVEVYAFDRSAGTPHAVQIFRSTDLGDDTLARQAAGLIQRLRATDTLKALGSADVGGQATEVVVARNARFEVFVGYPTTDIARSLSSLRSSFFVLLPLALLVSILGGLWLARKALRPIEQIADTARDISAKNLSLRIDIPNRTDHELSTLTTTLNSMFSRLEGSFQRVNQFTSDASHELKTPLAIMKGEIEQLHRHLEHDKALGIAETRTAMESLMEEVDRMQRIVEGLLLVSKADEKRLTLDLQRTEIYPYLESLAEDGAILAEERGLTLRHDLDAHARDATILADGVRLYQVVMNLLDNALKYTGRGGLVTIFLRDGGDAVTFGVCDTGVGIAADELPNIFHRFYRTDSARSGPHNDADRSLGLGLAIVKSIVEAHDGSIGVTSELGVGTEFGITMRKV